MNIRRRLSVELWAVLSWSQKSRQLKLTLPMRILVAGFQNATVLSCVCRRLHQKLNGYDAGRERARRKWRGGKRWQARPANGWGAAGSRACFVEREASTMMSRAERCSVHDLKVCIGIDGLKHLRCEANVCMRITSKLLYTFVRWARSPQV